ncbi:MAG: TraR/DksA family transcriptional regulator [Spirochaetales bacterium]|nr:TraR/DksA family transcriptional regulator [Spirochaetales bacterium]
MDKKFLGKMKKVLIGMKEEILGNLMAENEAFEALVKDLDPKDLADIAADDIDRKTLEVLSTHEINRLRLIENAISRINNDRYGICISCNKKIPPERLEAIPYAFMCIECQTSDERRNR